jgi:hypothetical protein
MPYKINFILPLKILTLNDIGRVSDFENETFTINIQTINTTNVWLCLMVNEVTNLTNNNDS